MDTSISLVDFPSFYENLELKLPSRRIRSYRSRMIRKFAAR